MEILAERFKDEQTIEYLLLDGYGLAGVDDGSVDAAFSYGVFVHLQHWDMFNYLCELHRVLRPGGRGIIQHPNTLSELGWARFVEDLPGSLNRYKRGATFSVMTP